MILFYTIKFISFKNSNETLTMPAKINNKEIMISNERDKIIRELFESLFQRFRRKNERK